MLEIDKWSRGFGPQLTPRQCRILYFLLLGRELLHEDIIHKKSLLEWFESEIKVQVDKGLYILED
jgi:hypothetical protein